MKGLDGSLLGVSLDVTGDLPDVAVVAVLGSLPGTRPIDAALCEFLLGLGDMYAGVLAAELGVLVAELGVLAVELGVLAAELGVLAAVSGVVGSLPGTRPPDAYLDAFLLGLGDSANT